jgi:hypothetical protein
LENIFKCYSFFIILVFFCCLVMGNYKLKYRTLRQLHRKQQFIVPAQTQWTHVQRPCPENKGVSPYISILASRLQKQKARSNPCLVIFNSIGYFTLVLRNVPSSFHPQCYVTLSTFRFLSFYLSAMPSLPPCYFIRTQA